MIVLQPRQLYPVFRKDFDYLVKLGWKGALGQLNGIHTQILILFVTVPHYKEEYLRRSSNSSVFVPVCKIHVGLKR